MLGTLERTAIDRSFSCLENKRNSIISSLERRLRGICTVDHDVRERLSRPQSQSAVVPHPRLNVICQTLIDRQYLAKPAERKNY